MSMIHSDNGSYSVSNVRVNRLKKELPSIWQIHGSQTRATVAEKERIRSQIISETLNIAKHQWIRMLNFHVISIIFHVMSIENKNNIIGSIGPWHSSQPIAGSGSSPSPISSPSGASPSHGGCKGCLPVEVDQLNKHLTRTWQKCLWMVMVMIMVKLWLFMVMKNKH